MIPWEREPGVPASRHFALIPRAVVLHRMETSNCLDSRLFWLSILLSWCGPEVSPDGSVVLKDKDGFLLKDAKGKPIHAKQKDLIEYLGLDPQKMGASVCRAAARLEECGAWRLGKSISKNSKIIYPVQEPTLPSKDDPELLVQAILDWHIGTKHVTSEQLERFDTIVRTRKQAQLDIAKTIWLSSLKAARTQADGLVEQILSSDDNLIENSLKSLLAKDPPPASQPAIEEEPVAPEPEEEPAGWPVVEVPEEIPETQNPADEVRAYLESIPRPGLTPQIVEEVAKHITTPEALEAFKVETMPAKVQGAQTWKYFVAIAQRVGADAPRYAAAKANGGNGHSPPTRADQQAEAWLRRREAIGK